jgi:hypothetical protein
MALDAHLSELADKHRLLDRKIREEMSKPAADEAKIVRWKQEKLRLKDQIVRLEAQTRH